MFVPTSDRQTPIDYFTLASLPWILDLDTRLQIPAVLLGRVDGVTLLSGGAWLAMASLTDV